MPESKEGGTPAKQMPEELLEQSLKGYEKPEDLLGGESPLASLRKAVMECALEAELTDHLGYDRHGPADRRQRQQPRRSGQQDCLHRQQRGGTGGPT